MEAALISDKNLKPEFESFMKIPITKNEMTLGRALSNTVVIPFLSISRNHCKIIKTTDNNWILEDLSSLGIEVNGTKIGKGLKRQLSHEDVIKLEPSEEFTYKFIINPDETFAPPLMKRIKLETNTCNDLINNMKIKFEESQNIEIKHIEDKIKNWQQMQNNSIVLKEQLEIDMNRKIKHLENEFQIQIENLKGEKDEVERQKTILIDDRDAQLASIKQEMEGRITDLMNQIKKHNEAKTELLNENRLLKEKLLKEREEFLIELNRENSSKQDMLEKLEAKIREQDETCAKEKKILEETLKQETEKLKEAMEKELKELEEQKKSKELELMTELNSIKKNLEDKIEQSEQEKKKTEQLAIEKAKMELLVQEREDIQKKLIEAQKNSEKRLEQLQQQVQERETELAALAADRIQQQVEQSSNVIKSLQDQLEKVRNQLQCVETEKQTLLGNASNSGGEGTSKQSTLAQVGELVESELQCSICAELFVSPISLNCSHTFCKYCISKWKTKKKDCPICRAPITSECKNLVLESFMEKILQNLTEEVKEKRQELLKHREAEVTAMTTQNTPTRTSRGRRRRNQTQRPTNTGPTIADTHTTTPTIPTVDLTQIPSPNRTRPAQVIQVPAVMLRPRVGHQQLYQIIQVPRRSVMVLRGEGVAASRVYPVRTTAVTATATIAARVATGRRGVPFDNNPR